MGKKNRVMVEKDGKYSFYDSVKEASEATGDTTRVVYKCIERGHMSRNGYCYDYEDE